MRDFRKFISLLLVFVLVLSLCPAGFAAEDVDGAEILEEAELIEPDIIETEPAEPGETESEEVPPEPEEPEEVTEEPAEEPVGTEDGAEAGENESEEPEEEEKSEEEKDGESEEEIEEKSEEEEEKEKLFPGMPEGYVLSAEEMAAKQALDANGVVEALAEAVPGVDYVDGEVFFIADTPEYAQLVADAYGAVLAEYAGGVAVLTLNGASVLDAVTTAADMNNNMPAVEANYIYGIIPEPDVGLDDASTFAYRDENGVSVNGSWKAWYESTANPDTYMSQPSSYYYQYMHDIVNTYEAWGVTKGAGVTVAVVDSGVANHDDLDGNVIVRESVGSWGDLTSNHGTHVAGIIAAQMGNGKGGAGIAPEAKIYSERVFGEGSTSDIVRGINNVITAKRSNPSIKVMNMSLGGYTYSWSMEYAVRRAISVGITVVAAMGNDVSNIQCYPAALNIPGLIAVQSSTAANTLSPFSNYGPWADVTAPGSDIMSTVFNNGYSKMSGTSMATPVVAGVCALYLSVYPYASPAQVESAIKKASNKGIVDASKLFSAENKAPVITPEEPKDKDGSLPYGSYLKIEVVDSSETIIYTVGGKAPSIKNGVITGTVVEGGAVWLPITSENGFTVGKNVAVKAAAVNGFGKLSKVTSLTVKVGYADATGVEITAYPQKLISGKSFTLTAKVLPAEANQKLIWQITDMNGAFSGTSVNNSGALKTGAKDKGIVTVRAYAADGSIKSPKVKIEVATLDPTKKITLSADGYAAKSVTMLINSYGRSSDVQLSALSYKASGNVYSDTYVWKSSNTKVVTVNKTGLVSVVGMGNATITCMASDGTNVKTTLPVKVLSCAEELTISGFSTVAAGKTATYTAAVLPKTAKYKTVSWFVDDNDYGITIDQRGKVTVPAYTPPDTYFTIRAYSGPTAWAVKTVRVSPVITQVKTINLDNGFNGLCKYNVRDGSLTEVTLFSTDAFDSDSGHYSYIQLGLMDQPFCKVQVTSSNPKVVTVDEDGLVTAVAPGRAKITSKATDAGRKSHSVNIVVVNPASSITVVPKIAATETLSSGKSVQNIASLGDAYGTPTVKKVAWDFKVTRYNRNGGYAGDCTYYARNNKLISISSSGNLTAAKNAYAALREYYGSSYSFRVYAIARATDGSYISGSSTEYYLASAPISKLVVSGYGKIGPSVKLPGYLQKSGYYAELQVASQYAGYSGYYYFYDWTVKSSNPNVAGAIMAYDENDKPVVQIIAGEKAGTATITLTATDGSNKKATVTVTVK